jgi:hypothetical protein
MTAQAITCASCGKQARPAGKGMCSACYEPSRPKITCAEWPLARIRTAAQFTASLDRAGRSLGTATQSHLDAWTAELPSTAPLLRGFVIWAVSHGYMAAGLEVPGQPSREERRAIDDEDRIALADRPRGPPAARPGQGTPRPPRRGPDPAVRPVRRAAGQAQGRRRQPRRRRARLPGPRGDSGTAQGTTRPPGHHGRRQRAPVWQPVAVPRRKRPDVQRPVPPPTHQSRRQQRAAGPQFRTRLARRRRPVGAARGPAWPLHRRRRRLVEGRRRGPRGLRRAADQPAQRNGQALIGTAGNTSRAHRARQRHPARRSART